MSQIEEAQWALAEKEKQLGKLQEQEKALHTSFSEAIGENNKFKDFLMKVDLELENWREFPLKNLISNPGVHKENKACEEEGSGGGG